MDFLIYIAAFVLLVMICFLYIKILAMEEFSEGMVEMLARTLDYYYKESNIRPYMVNYGIDLVYNDDDEDTEELVNKKGFITIWYQGADCDTPIRDVKDADVLSEKIIKVTQKHLKDRDMGVEK